MNILTITPMREEFDSFLGNFTKDGLRAEESMIGSLPVVRFPDLGMTLAQGGTGKAQFALQTQHLLDSSSNWDLVICAGADSLSKAIPARLRPLTPRRAGH